MNETMTYPVPGMTSGHCRAAITPSVTVGDGGLGDAALVAAIDEAGYEAMVGRSANRQHLLETLGLPPAEIAPLRGETEGRLVPLRMLRTPRAPAASGACRQLATPSSHIRSASRRERIRCTSASGGASRRTGRGRGGASRWASSEKSTGSA